MTDYVMSILQNAASIHRIYYEKPNENSTKVMAYSRFGYATLGYPETDAHLKKRIQERILEENKK